jgi:hypothetical protein
MAMTQTQDETERESWTRRTPMSKDEKIAEIRRLREWLNSGLRENESK